MKTTRFIILALAVVGSIVLAWHHHWQAARPANAYRLIDAEIPGTEVYFREKLLGKTPLILSKADCASFGLPVTPDTLVDSDGWGEGLPFEDPTTDFHPRLMHKVPSSHASSFLNYETPWGLRTKLSGGWALPNGFRSKFMSRGQNGVGVVVNIDFNSQPNPTDKLLQVNVSVTNSGSRPYGGFRPEIELLWGTFEVQWQHRAHKTFALPAEWAKIEPGQMLHTIVEFPLPETAGVYSVFATFNVFQNEENSLLIGHGSVYSDSKLLRVP
jgi:hypothetical protein